jgi:hypothetical protein
MVDFTSSLAFRIAGPKAFAEAGIPTRTSTHLMIYDAFFRLSICSFEDLGFKPRGEAGAFIAEHNTAPGVPGTARRPGPPGDPAQHQWRRAFLHAFRHVRHVCSAGERAPDARHRARPNPRHLDLAKISVCHGVGGMFAPSGTIIMSNEPP